MPAINTSLENYLDKQERTRTPGSAAKSTVLMLGVSESEGASLLLALRARQLIPFLDRTRKCRPHRSVAWNSIAVVPHEILAVAESKRVLSKNGRCDGVICLARYMFNIYPTLHRKGIFLALPPLPTSRLDDEHRHITRKCFEATLSSCFRPWGS